MNDFDGILDVLAQVTPGPEDYTGEDGLLYCGKCRTPKQFRMKARPWRAACCPIRAAVNRNALTGMRQSRRPTVTVRLWLI